MPARQVQPVQGNLAIHQHADGLHADGIGIDAGHLGVDGGQHERRRVHREGHADAKPGLRAAAERGWCCRCSQRRLRGASAPPVPQQHKGPHGQEQHDEHLAAVIVRGCVGGDTARDIRRQLARGLRLALQLRNLAIEFVQLLAQGRILCGGRVHLRPPLAIAGIVLVGIEELRAPGLAERVQQAPEQQPVPHAESLRRHIGWVVAIVAAAEAAAESAPGAASVPGSGAYRAAAPVVAIIVGRRPPFAGAAPRVVIARGGPPVRLGRLRGGGLLAGAVLLQRRPGALPGDRTVSTRSAATRIAAAVARCAAAAAIAAAVAVAGRRGTAARRGIGTAAAGQSIAAAAPRGLRLGRRR